jgi:hypothetical protein
MWEPIAIDLTALQTEPVTINTPALRRAAHMLGVLLVDS